MRHSDDDQLSTLISRSITQQFWVLGISLVVILGISSALNAGLVASHKLDEAFLSQQFDDLAAFAPTVNLSDFRKLAAETDPATLLAIIHRLLLVGQSLSLSPGDAQTAKFSDAINRRLQMFEAHDRQRNQAFLIQLTLPYVSAPVSVNARQLAYLWPVCLIASIAIVLSLAYQRRAYEIVLCDSIATATTPRERARRSVLASFATGRLEQLGDTTLYHSPSPFRPTSIALTLLSLLLISLSIMTMINSDPSDGYKPGRIINYYYTPLIAIAILSFIGVTRIRSYYYRKASTAIGRRVRAYRTFHLHHMAMAVREALDRPLRRGTTLRRGLVFAFSLAALVSMLYAWIQPSNIAAYSGIDFLGSETEVTPSHNNKQTYLEQELSRRLDARTHASAPNEGKSATPSAPARTIPLYPIPPDIFAEMRWHVYTALLFILLCIAHECVTNHVSRISLRRVRWWLAVTTGFLIVNFLAYLLMLWFHGNRGDVLEPTLDMLFEGLSGRAGLPLFFIEPTRAFALFVVSCSALVVLSVMNTRPRLLSRRLRRRAATGERAD